MTISCLCGVLPAQANTTAQVTITNYAGFQAANSNHTGEIIIFYATIANAGNNYSGVAGSNSNGSGRLLITGNVTNASVDLGSSAGYYTAVFNDNTAAMQALGCTTSPIDFSTSTGNLPNGSTFNVRIYCASAPTATTNAASGVTATGATLNGAVNDNEGSTSVSFDYGTTTGYGANASATTGGTLVAGAGSTAASVAVSGLSCGTVYHYRVVATNSAGTTNGADQTFTSGSCGATVSGISPASGPTAGGNAVTISGTGFTGATAVTIGGTPATSVTVVNDSTITALAPAGTVGAKDVAVTTPGGTDTGVGVYTYVAAPTVTAINPTAGPLTSGTAVTITGTNLTGASSVTIGGVAATGVIVVNATTITATAPSGTAGAKNVTVTTVGGTGTGTGLYTYVPAPTVTAISPTAGPLTSGTAVTITGTNLSGATAISIGGVAATGVTVVNATTITATAPAGTSGAKDVTVTTVGGIGTGTGLYTYVPAPTVASISPTAGPTAGGTVVTITGTNLSGATAVTIGGVAVTGMTVVNATTITATTPAGTSGAKSVAVTTVGGTGTGSNLFTYVPAPTVAAISPTAGPTVGGTSVTITGTNFSGATAVTIGGVAVTGMTVVSATTITATAPAGTTGAKDVVVTTVGGTGTGTGIYTYVAAPTVTGISPNTGSTGGGTSVTITGTNLSGATVVTVGGVAATGVTVVSATTVTATTPAGTPGAKDVAVTTVGGTATATGAFTYNLAPVFVDSTTATLTVLQDSGAADLKGLLVVSDTDIGQTETWSEAVAPSHGTLSFTSATASSGSTSIRPSGTITYTPASGYAGSDTFTVRVSDGIATATRVVNVIISPAAAGIPYVPPPPPVPGVSSQPAVLNLGTGNGPTMTNCLMDTLRQNLTGTLTLQGQDPISGEVKIAWNGQTISFYPVGAQSTNTQTVGIHLGGGNTLDIATACGTFSMTPAVTSTNDLGAVLNAMGITAQINAQGVITLYMGGAWYVLRPDYFVTPGAPGTPSLTRGADGVFRFRDSAGNTQILRPAFLDTMALQSYLTPMGGSISVQLDGTAVLSLGPNLYAITPDVNLGDSAPDHASQNWWEEGGGRYRYRNTVSGFQATTQGFTLR